MSTENLFGVFVTQALAQREVMPYLMQGGLGMPEREYYLSTAPDMRAHQAAYRKYIGDMLAAAGIADAPAKAQRIWDLELKIAAAHATREERDDWSKAHADLDARRTSPRRRRASTGRPSSKPRSSAAQQKFDAFDAGADPASLRRWSDRSRWTLEGLADLPPDQPERRRSCRPSSTS